jgi:CRISPR-associated protein Csx10
MTTRFYPYAITLEAPAIFTRPQGDPNSATSYPFVQGTALRGAVAAALARSTNQVDSDTFRTLILSGQVCYLNAYPSAAGRTTVPAPLSFRKEKYQETYHDLTMYSGEVGEDHQVDASLWPQEALEGIGLQFLSLGGSASFGNNSIVTSAAHHQRDRVMGRAYQESDEEGNPGQTRGALFTYEAIEAGQEFHGALVVSGSDESEVERRFQQVSDALANQGNQLLLGRSRRARYGGLGKVDWRLPATERFVTSIDGIVNHNLAEGQEFLALLVSDCLGRNAYTGQSDPQWIETELQTRLDNRLTVIRRRLGFRLAGGYNNTWGLPLPQALALEAGSVLVLQARASIPMADLLDLEQSGLGERRAEGFGRLLFLEAPVAAPSIVTTPTSYQEPPNVDSPTVQLMQSRLLQDAIGQDVLLLASNAARHANNIPSPSLLRRLQLPLRNSLTVPESQAALDSLNQTLRDLRRPAQDSLNRCRISLPDLNRRDIRLKVWLQQIVNGQEELDRLLPLAALAQQYHITSSDEALGQVRQGESWIRVRLLLEILSALARRKGREE